MPDEHMSAAPNSASEARQARAAYAGRLAAGASGSATLNELAELAARLLGAPSAQVSIISAAQTVVGGSGQAASAVGGRSPAAESLCTVTVDAAAPVAVTDAPRDPRVSGLPPVTSGMVGAYLGVPLQAAGHTVGALCVFDPAPRTWSDHDLATLQLLAVPVLSELQLAALADDYEQDRLGWQLAVDVAGIGAFDWDLATGELRWDERLQELFGLEPGSFGGTIEAFDAAVHPEDGPRVTQALTEAVKSCGELAVEYRIVLPDGSVRWIAARGRALPGEGDIPGRGAARVLGAAYDTTAVQDGEARVARVLDAMPTAFFHLDRDWRFTYLNAEAERLLVGIGRDVVGGVIWELFPAAVGSDFETHYRGAAASGKPVTFDAFYPPPLDGWYEVRAWPTPDGLSVYFIDVSTQHAAQEQADRAARRAVLLAEVTEALAGTLDVQEAVDRLTQLIVPPLGDWCVVTLVDQPGPAGAANGAAGGWRRRLRDVSGWHADPEARPLVERYTQARVPALRDTSFLARAFEEGRPVVVAEQAAEAIRAVLEPGEARDLCLQLDPSSVAVVPLRGRGRTVGLISVFRDRDREAFSPEDVETLVDAAGRAGLALDNARLYGEQRDLAEVLQRSLLTAPPATDQLQIAVRYEPAAETAQLGGDWYDAFLKGRGCTAIVIGDVVGHDTAAAASMGQVRGLLRGIAVATADGPADVLRRVDGAMSMLQVDTTATAVVAQIEQTSADREKGTARLRWSNAGHPPPMLMLRPGGPGGPGGPAGPGGATVQALEADQSDLLLGLDPDFERAEWVRPLPPEATVLLYTDGLVERRGQSLDEGLAALRSVLTELVDAGLGLEETCDELLRRMLPDRPEDDVAIVAVRLNGASD